MSGKSGPAVAIKGLTKVFPKESKLPLLSFLQRHEGKKAVKDLNLEVHKGEIFGFLGPNGAGKSTVMAIIAGILRPTKGTVRIFGTDIEKDGTLVKERIGFSPEVPALYSEMKALDLVTYHAEFYGPDAKEKARKTLVGLGLKDSLDIRAAKLSYGNQKKVSLAIALVHEPDLVLLDEPTTGLDPRSVIVFRDIIKDLKEKGTTVFLSSHVLTEVERMCTTIGILVDGQLRLLEPTEQLLKKAGPGGLEKVFLEMTGGAPTAS